MGRVRNVLDGTNYINNTMKASFFQSYFHALLDLAA